MVLITGGNSGFGLAGVRAFASSGHQVVATVRSEQRKKELQACLDGEGLHATIKLLELTEPASFPKLVESIIDEHGRIDVLVNNAGTLRPGACEDLKEADIRDVMETNFMAPMLLSRAVLPQMRAQGSGLIIMISSLSGIAGLAGDVFYTASKFALEGATEALRHEVDRFGVRVALIEAAQYATELFAKAAGANLELPADYPANSPYRELVRTKLSEIAAGLPEARDPMIVGDLMLTIASSNTKQLRWQADELSEMVVSSLHGKSDLERDEFLRGASNIDWWSDGRSSPITERD